MDIFDTRCIVHILLYIVYSLYITYSEYMVYSLCIICLTNPLFCFSNGGDSSFEDTATLPSKLRIKDVVGYQMSK